MKFAWVLPNLAFGPAPRVDAEFQELKSLQVTAILSLQTDEERVDAGVEGERCAAHRAGLVFSSFPIEDFNHAESSGLFTRQRGRAWNFCSSRAHCVRSLLSRGEPVPDRRGGLSALVPANWISCKPSLICMHVVIACQMRTIFTSREYTSREDVGMHILHVVGARPNS